MDVPTAKRICKSLKVFPADWKPKVFFAMSGEPLMNPNLPEILRVFREALPESNFAIISNGDLLHLWKSDDIFKCVDLMIVDTYDDKSRNSVQKFIQRNEAVELIDFYGDWAPNGRSPFSDLKRKIQNTIVAVDDLSMNDGKVASRRIHNYGGNAPFLKKPLYLKKICVNPIRELVIKYDGTVPICCMDVGNEFILGNLKDSNVHDIWFSDVFISARRLLRRGMRGFSPCAFCNASLPSSYTMVNSSTLEWPHASDFRNISEHLKSLLKAPKNGRKRIVV
jgi:hypothetical protein